MPTFHAVATPGLEPVTQRELADLGLAGQVVPGGVVFETDLARGAVLAARLRTPGRLLLEVARGQARSLEQLAQVVRKVDWSPYLVRGCPVEVAATTRASRLRFREAVEKKVGFAISDAVGRPLHGHRAPPTQRVQVRLVEDQLTLSLDCGGELLHRRGWRQATAKAPLRENLAAALLLMAGYSGDEALVDPMCGAGTLPIEAARIALGLPPGVDRRYAFEAWPALAKVRLPAARPGPLPCPILGADRDPGAIRASTENAERARVPVEWRHVEVGLLEPPTPTGLVVCNPPYGVRVGTSPESAGGAMVALGRALRERFGGWRALWLAPSPELARKVHRAAEQLTRFDNGGIKVGVWVVEL